jgi:hypothetical protein
MIADLDADDFQVREKASQRLERLGPEVAFALRLTLDKSPSPEVRSRIEEILDKLKQSGKESRILEPSKVRLCLAILEEIGTPEAERVLQELAKGPSQSTVTPEVRAALERFAKQPKAP